MTGVRLGFVEGNVNMRSPREVLNALEEIMDKEAEFIRVSKEITPEELWGVRFDSHLSSGLFYFEKNKDGKYTIHYWKSQ